MLDSVKMLKSESRQVLFVVAHPYLQRSKANRAVVDAVSTLDGVKVHRLYDLYPYFQVDVDQEKQLLAKSDAIVIQHPLYWYSMPALLKLWLDEVFESGWAYGPGGEKLKDKDFLLSITAGGGADSYSETGHNRFPLETLLAPWNQTARLCQMRWQTPSVLHGSIGSSDNALDAHAEQVRERIAGFLRRGRWD